MARQELLEETSFISTVNVFWLVSFNQFGKDIFEPVAGRLKTYFPFFATNCSEFQVMPLFEAIYPAIGAIKVFYAKDSRKFLCLFFKM